MPTTWSITADAPEQYDFDTAGNPVIGHKISFLTGAGNRGTVFVPQDHYNVNAVRAMVAAAAKTADQVRALTGEA